MKYPAMWIAGNPKTKGSWIPVKTKAGIKFRPATKGGSKWYKHAESSLAAQWGRKSIDEGPVRVGLMFLLPRPKTVARAYPTSKYDGDLDKLMRAILDSMTGVVYRDDSQVVSAPVDKRYADAEAGVWVNVDTDL